MFTLSSAVLYDLLKTFSLSLFAVASIVKAYVFMYNLLYVGNPSEILRGGVKSLENVATTERKTCYRIQHFQRMGNAVKTSENFLHEQM